MPTYHQIVFKPRRKKIHTNNVKALNKCPQKKGVCMKLRIVKPKKPNSAQRKVVKLRLSSRRMIIAYIPGQGHNLQEYSSVLVSGGRAPDLPGVRYTLVKGKYDFSWKESFDRKKRIIKIWLFYKKKSLDLKFFMSEKKSKYYKKKIIRRKIWYNYRIYRPKRRKYNRFFQIFKKKKLKKISFYKIKRRIFLKSRFMRHFFRYLRLRFDSLRTKKFLLKFGKKRGRKRVWRFRLRTGFKFVLRRFLSRRNNGFFRYKKIAKYYKIFGLRRFFKKLLRVSRLKFTLKKFGKVYINRPRRGEKKRIIKIKDLQLIEKLRFVDFLLSSFIKKGKKKLSNTILIKVITLLKFKYKQDFFKIYVNCLERIRPLVKYKLIYSGGKKYKIPVLMPISKSYKIAVRWLIQHSLKNNGFVLSFFSNINSSSKNEGVVVKFRKEYHLTSFENKSYIYFLKRLKKGF